MVTCWRMAPSALIRKRFFLGPGCAAGVAHPLGVARVQIFLRGFRLWFA